MTQPVDSASLSWIIAFLRTGGQLWGHRDIKMASLRVEGSWKSVWVWSTCQWAVFPSCPRAVLTCLRGELPHPYHLHHCLLRPLLSGMALPLSAAHLHGWGGVGRIQLKEMLWMLWKAPQPWGRWVKGPCLHKGTCLPHLWLCGLSIHLLTVKTERQSALRLFNSFSIFFQHWKNNFLKLWFFFLNHLAGGKGKGKHQKL